MASLPARLPPSTCARIPLTLALPLVREYSAARPSNGQRPISLGKSQLSAMHLALQIYCGKKRPIRIVVVVDDARSADPARRNRGIFIALRNSPLRRLPDTWRERWAESNFEPRLQATDATPGSWHRALQRELLRSSGEAGIQAVRHRVVVLPLNVAVPVRQVSRNIASLRDQSWIGNAGRARRRLNRFHDCCSKFRLFPGESGECQARRRSSDLENLPGS